MITIVEIFTIMIITIIIVLGIPIAIVWVMFKKIPDKYSTLVAILFVIVFYFSLNASTAYLAANPSNPDLSKPFAFTGSNIGETDIGQTRFADFEQAKSLHNKMVSYNITDPLSFLFEDTPKE